ncbi:MAG: N-acetylneuraminate synthase family protein [Candidatus Pacearchaeota archaeon]|jgi:N-acetylneuraminate synthase
MPKDGFDSITVPDHLAERIEEFVSKSGGIVGSKTQALSQAWQIYERIFLEEKNPKPVKLGNKLIGHNHPVFVIAEIGINHNGSLEIAKKMIDMAVNSGCDAVKFQKRTIEIIYTPEELAKPRESPFGKTNGDLKRGLEFGEEDFREIDRYCKEKGIIWFASPWDIPSVDFLEKFNVPCHKIASATLTDKDLLLRIKQTGKPIILSSAMSHIEEIEKAVKILGEDNLILMHCTATYPTSPHEHDLNVIKTFRKYFNCPIGYSGHEPGVIPTIVAASIGACVLERHITLDRSMFGSDQAASLERKGLETICTAAKLMPTILGGHHKKIHDSEHPIKAKLRRVDTL